MVKSVAIVGANGFLGKYLVAAFHQKGFSVVAVYNKSFSLLGLDLHFIQGVVHQINHHQ